VSAVIDATAVVVEGGGSAVAHAPHPSKYAMCPKQAFEAVCRAFSCMVSLGELATDDDVEELEEELEKAKKKARRRMYFGLAFSAVTFILGAMI
jgi:hypothetical protein